LAVLTSTCGYDLHRPCPQSLPLAYTHTTSSISVPNLDVTRHKLLFAYSSARIVCDIWSQNQHCSLNSKGGFS
jgi:hypothetical protein